MVRTLTIATVLVASLATVTSGTASAPGRSITVIFRGSYVLDSRAGQASFEPASPSCVPGSQQHETESVTWTIRFAGPSLPEGGAVTLRQQSAAVSGPHLWDERSVKCAADPSGHLVCRTHFASGQSQLEVEAADRTWIFHPRLALIAISDGCTGKVYNEHPDCGARDAAAITDFAFLTRLRREAPQVRLPGRTASFDVRRAAFCTQPGGKVQPGDRNPRLIRQHSVARYAGTLTVLS